jgi:hypothetical protein
MGTHTFCILKCVPLLSSRGAWKIVTGTRRCGHHVHGSYPVNAGVIRRVIFQS